jgi:hypothetical protein
MVMLYRAGPAGSRAFAGLTSWTSSRTHAAEYGTTRFFGFGGEVVYQADVTPSSLLDLRASTVALADIVDLDDYDEPLHDVLRHLGTSLLRPLGFDWVAFCEHPTDPTFDEWLYVDGKPIPVTPSG